MSGTVYERERERQSVCREGMRERDRKRERERDRDRENCSLLEDGLIEITCSFSRVTPDRLYQIFKPAVSVPSAKWFCPES